MSACVAVYANAPKLPEANDYVARMDNRENRMRLLWSTTSLHSLSAQMVVANEVLGQQISTFQFPNLSPRQGKRPN